MTQLEIWGVIFVSTLSMSHHISSRRIRNSIDFTTATSLIHSKLDYCNYPFLNLPKAILSRLQLILNSTARTVSQTPKCLHITPVLKSVHWLKIEQRIQYKVISLTYKTLQSNTPVISMACFTFSATETPAPKIVSLPNVLPFNLL